MKTKYKIFVARSLAIPIIAIRKMLGKGRNALVKRSGVVWDLDLSEGIELSIYLFGCFERSTVDCYRRYIKPGDCVFDIGANIGAHTLYFSSLVGEEGIVHSFEPTEYAVKKLKENIRLNPDLSRNIIVNHAMVVSAESSEVPDALYSSWNLLSNSDIHPDHYGTLKSTGDAGRIILDEYVRSNGVASVDFMKIDVDGYEMDVLYGAEKLLDDFRPVILIELAPYVLLENDVEPKALVDFLLMKRYRLFKAETMVPLGDVSSKIISDIRSGESINVLALPIE